MNFIKLVRGAAPLARLRGALAWRRPDAGHYENTSKVKIAKQGGAPGRGWGVDLSIPVPLKDTDRQPVVFPGCASPWSSCAGFQHTSCPSHAPSLA